MPIPALFCLLLLLLSPSWALAAHRGHDALVERQLRHVVVDEGGAYTVTVEKVLLLGAGAKAQASQRIGYSNALDQLVSVEGHTEKPDGQRHALAPGMVGTRPLDDPPALGHTHEAIVHFPEVAPGDRLLLRYVLRRHTPLIAGHFDDIVSDDALAQRDFRVLYELPASLALHADAIGFIAIAATHPEGRRRYAWQYAAAAPSPQEAGAVSLLDAGNRLAVSTTAEHETLALLVHQQLTQALHEGQSSALARHDGMRSILALAAQQAAQGTAYRLALVNHGSAYQLTEVPTLALLNHVLLYLPQEQQYLDAGLVDGGSEQLPAGVLGKPALLSNPAGFAMLPFSQPWQLQGRERIDIAGAGRRQERVATAPQRTESALATALTPLLALRERRLPFMCPAINASAELTMQLAPGVRVAALPRALTVDAGNFVYMARYRRLAQQVVVERSFVFRHTGPTCLPEDLARMQSALARVRRDLSTELLVRRAAR